MRTTVSTHHLPPSDRFGYWVDKMSGLFVSLDTYPASAAPFHGTASNARFGAVQLSALTAGPLRVRRTELLASREEEDFYKICLQLSGTALIEQDGTRSRLDPGDLAICDTSRAYSFTYETDFNTVLMLVPRPLIPLRPDALRVLTGHRIATSEGVGAVVAPFLRSLTEQSGNCAGPATSRMADGAVSLITALVSERIDRAPSTGPHRAMTLRIQNFIERRLSDPDLSPDAIAEAHGISRRYLYKLFAAEQTTVSGWIRTRRLERCARDLLDPALRDQPVAVIAARWGFLDARHFARTFKTGYEETPRDYRRRAFAAPAQQDTTPGAH